MDWYWLDETKTGDRRSGPIAEDAFLDLLRKGTIEDRTLVWNMQLDDWRPWSVVRENEEGKRIQALLAPQEVLASHQIGPDVLQTPEPPLAPVRDAAQVVSQDSTQYAGFWIRTGALLIDWLAIQVVFLPMGIVLGLLYPSPPLDPNSTQDLGQLLDLMVKHQWPLLLGQFLFTAFYNIAFVARYGGTPGKMMLGLTVLNSDGSPVGWGASLGRHFASQISTLTFCFGYILATVGPRCRSLHDMLANTIVVRNNR